VSDDCDPSKDFGGLGSCPLSRVVRRIDREDVLLMMKEGQIFCCYVGNQNENGIKSWILTE
jgi:hypothetical protein